MAMALSGNASLTPSPGALWPTSSTSGANNFCPGVILRSALENALDKDSDSVETTSSESCSTRKPMKNSRDPSSHRMIEKRRRDRMNNCLASLSKLIPQAYLNKGRGRVEKTEIIEMAIKYIKHVKTQNSGAGRGFVMSHGSDTAATMDKTVDAKPVVSATPPQPAAKQVSEKYRQGFYDCIAETMRFLAGVEGIPMTPEVNSRLMSHLETYCSQRCQASVPRSEPPSVIQKTTAATDDQPLNMSLKSNQGHHVQIQDSGHQSYSASYHQQGVSSDHHLHLSPPGVSLSEKCGNSSSGSSTHYPSSPGSFQSMTSGNSATPPRSVTPPYNQNLVPDAAPRVPVFALHASGQFYFADNVAVSSLSIDISSTGSNLCQEDMRADCHLVSIPVKFNMGSFVPAHKLHHLDHSPNRHHAHSGGHGNVVPHPTRDWTSALAHFDPRQRIAAHFGTAPDSSTNMDHP